MVWSGAASLCLLGCILLCPHSLAINLQNVGGVCVTLNPDLGFPPQTVPAPFEITVDKDSFKPGQDVTVSISATGRHTIHGFLIQARRAYQGDKNEAIGYFIQSIGKTRTMCDSRYGRGLTHDDNFEPTRKVTVVWNGPVTPQGHIHFRATILAENNTYWVAEMSQVIREELTATQPPEGTTKAPTELPSVTISMDGCGDTKGCYRNPKGCSEVECDVALTWEDKGDTILFELSADTDGWVAVGFSEDKKMGKDDVTECVWDYSEHRVVVRQSYNLEDRKKNEVISPPDWGIVGWEAHKSDGRIRCRFERTKDVLSKKRKFDLGRSYHLLVTRGDVSSEEPLVKKMHEYEAQKYPYVSPGKVSLRKRLDISGRAKYPLVKVHGCLMLIGWMLCATTAVLLAKYYKPMWPNDKLCGTKVWFSVHRGCLLTTLVCTIIAFILIFVHAGQYSQLPELPMKAHPPLGITTTILVILNPLLALCRCRQKSRWRPVFNWIHWFLGTVATVLSIPTLLIGLNLPKADVPWWATWVIVSFLLFHLIIELLLEIHGCINARKQKRRDEEFMLTKKADVRGDYYHKHEPVGYHFKRRVLTVYLVVAVILTIVMVITVAVC